MSLKDDIAKFMEQFTKNVPEKIRAVMTEEAERLGRSGITGNCLKAGDKAPRFSLPNQAGKIVSSSDLLAKGPLVLSFYRGGW